MIATNLLLGLSLSVIANFTNVVPLPDGAAPASTNDLQRFLIGRPLSPANVLLWTKSGADFEICDGVVDYFECADSYFHARVRDKSQIPKLLGDSILSQDQAMRIASNTLQRLLRGTNSMANCVPYVEPGGLYDGKRIPFFYVNWPVIGGIPYGASVEIDGRNGKVVFLHLLNPAFLDLARAKQIEDQVYKPDSVNQTVRASLTPVRDYLMPQPGTNSVLEAIKSWSSLCRRLGVPPGGQTNLSDINWDRTWVYTNEDLSSTAPVCQIRFKNGTCFESIGGVAFSHYSEDACYTGIYTVRPQEEWARFRGRILKDESDLARNLERLLVEKIGIPSEMLAPLSPALGSGKKSMQAQSGKEVGNVAIKRDVVSWRNWPRNAGRTVWTSETSLYFSAEFDLESGELKWISFADRKLIEALARAQGKSLSLRQ